MVLSRLHIAVSFVKRDEEFTSLFRRLNSLAAFGFLYQYKHVKSRCVRYNPVLHFFVLKAEEL
jgi:hypothetical protein